MKNINQKETTPSDKNNYLNTNIKVGLSTEEVSERQKKFGLNTLKKIKRKNIIYLFFGQLKEIMSILLLFAGLFALGLTIYQHIEDPSNPDILAYSQSLIILLIVFVNAFFSAIQEYKSNNAIEALQKMSSPKSKVLRDGKMNLISSNELTIGDIITVEAGDMISADCLLIDSSNLKCIEATLTGESMPVDKDHTKKSNASSPIGSKFDHIFSGCNVINGRGTGIVIGIGNLTEIGKVADLLSDTDLLKTPLQHKLHKLGQKLGLFGIFITMISFIFSLLVIENVIEYGFDSFPPSIILAISLATASIPEGLNTVVNIILAIGVKRMSDQNGLIKKLSSVETLGSTAVICSDKTGTLTMNKMTVIKMWVPKSKIEDVNNDKAEKLSKEHLDLLKYATLCTDCVIEESDEGNVLIGDPTEIAIAEFAIKKGYDDDKWDEDHKRVHDIPFDSDRKMMTSINIINGKQIAIVKGAPDVLFSKCKNIDLKQLKEINNRWSDSAVRVLAVAYKEIKGKLPKEIHSKDIEKDLRFMGLIGMIDPPREEVKHSIQICKSAGIKPVMITGDHLNTAIAIAKNLGIMNNNDLAITGNDLDELSDDDLIKNIQKYSVYARVSPENKIRIVKAWQSLDQVVAMTGDGVNDAPALKAADIGCAMGITGTDVSKGAADMVLTDDNFSTIVSSVRSGRGIYQNIIRIIEFLISSNIASVISILLGMFLFYIIFEDPNVGLLWGRIDPGIFNSFKLTLDMANEINRQIKFQTTLTTIQILITNVVIETLPGIALGTQRTSDELMKFRPRSKYESIFANGLIIKIIILGLINGILTIIAFTLGAFIAINTGAPGLRFYYGTVAAFLTLSLGCVAKSISISSHKLLFIEKFNHIKWVLIACFGSLIIVLISTLVPQVSSLFGERPELVFEGGLAGLSQADQNNILNIIFNGKTANNIVHGYIYLVGFSLAIIPFIVIELEKLFKMKFHKYKAIEDNSEFKLIPKPKTLFEKYRWLSVINFNKDNKKIKN
ncbi:MAG: cation-translocating P-type ATPase [Mycoplasmoidaceae bacterium]